MPTPMVYIDCSPLMHELVGELGCPDGLEVYEGDPSPAELASLVADAAIVLNGHTAMGPELLDRAKALRSIIYLGTGATSYIDVADAGRRGIRVRTIRGYGDRTVAEHGFALLLAAARDVARMDRDVRAGRWAAREGVELKGRTLGLLGLGGIGSEMARMASAFGMRVIAWNRSGVPAGVPAEAVDLDTLLATSDAISLHLALTPETRGMIDAARIDRMKRGVLLVNTARGAIIDEAALVAALQEGRIGHAALDVFVTEPLPAGHALTRLENVTLASHAGWKSRAASSRLLKQAFDILASDRRALEAGQELGE